MIKYESIVSGVNGGDYDLVSIVNDAVSLLIKLESSPDDIVDVKFSSPAMYSVMNECYGLSTIKERPDDETDGSLIYRVYEGEFLESFHVNSFNIYRSEHFEHYVIMCMDDIVHVVAYEPPVISQFSA